MKSMMKLFVGVVSVAVVLAVAAPLAEAQCAAGARAFATVGGGGGTIKLRINPAGTSGNQNTAIGRFWQASDSASGNNFKSSARG